MTPISVVIITFNEEKNLERCLNAILDIADDIVVLDSFSSDKTEEICKKFNVRFFQNKFHGYVEQKNIANSKAKYPNVLSLDADEVVSEELKSSILAAKNNWQYDGYVFNRLTNYCGKWIRHSGWYPDSKLRLWDTRKGAWDGILIHEKVVMEGRSKIVLLKGDLLHYSYYTVDQHLEQIKKFTTIMAQEQFQKGKKPYLWKILLKPLWKFVKSYFFDRGFLDGYYGFVICAMSAFATFMKYVKARMEFEKGSVDK